MPTIMKEFGEIAERTKRLQELLEEDTSIVEETECDWCGAFHGEHRKIPQDEYSSEGELIGVGTLERNCPNS